MEGCCGDAGREHRLELNAAPLREVSRWPHRYERFWNASLDRLTAYAEEKEAGIRRGEE